MNAFHLLGTAFAVWAVVLAVLGLRKPSFPGGRGGARMVTASAILLAGATIVAARITGEQEHREKEEAHAKEHEPEPAPPGTLKVTADPGGQLRFLEQRLEASAGAVTIEMANPAPLPHNIVIEGPGVAAQGPTVGRGGTSTARAELRPGRYIFFCAVQGHREGGMQGTLSIR